MIGRWIAAHRSVVATATSGMVIVAVVAAAAVMSTGYTAQRMDLDDGAVWVANGSRQVVGRANTEVLELNTVVRGEGGDLRVVQDAEQVLLVDRANASLDTIDTATSEVGETIALPPEQPEVFLAGDDAVIWAAGTGEVWIIAKADLASFDPLSTPTLEFGVDSAIAVDPAGVLWAYAAERQQVLRVDLASTDADTSWDVELPEPAGEYQVTAAGGRWAVLDTTTRQLATEAGVEDLSGLIAAEGVPELQAPSAGGDRILVGHAAGLVAVPAGGGDASAVVDGRTGVAAPPVRFDGCDYAAWADGIAWRRCGGEPATLTLAAMPANAALEFAARNSHLVLNDRRGGGTWAIEDDGALIDNWEELIDQEDDQEETEENDEDTPPDVEEQQQPPVAVNDEFGARPGKSTVLPVLLNDYDPNGDVIVISETTEVPERLGRVDLINRSQQLQVTLEPDARGSLSFGYTITDGRGGTSSATVTVQIRERGENAPPRQVRTTKTTVQSGGRVSTQVLGDWVDPDGDAFYLVSATDAGDGDATSKPDGIVVFRDDADGAELKSVALAVSDGRQTGTGALAVTVRPAGEVPIIADPFVVLTYAGQEVTVRPLEHVRGGTGVVRLNAVPAKTGVTVEPSFEAGTFTFVSDQVRTHYLEYVVTDDDQTVTGLVRVDVAAPPDADITPITIPKTVFITTLGEDQVDVAATDIDPAGGVLLVTGVREPLISSGVRAEVLDQRSVRVTLTGPLDGPQTFGYRVSNGLAEAEGTITVVEISPPPQLQPPIAEDDAVNVRVGDVIDIPVLDNDEQPDGFELELLPQLAQPLPDDGGLLFASGGRLRYLAPETAGNFTAVYTVASEDGQTAEARVQIAVRERNAATNSTPVPETVVARALAGSTVLIPIPLSGIDPDGDRVQLLGQQSSPEKGTVLSVGPDVIEYEAGAYSAGTDTFTYTVMDGLGARATGTVRVGISPRASGGRNPVAIDDTVVVRPGKTVSVQALVNDSDPDGSPLRIDSVQPNGDDVTAEIIDDEIVDITPPAEPGRYGLVYEISNDFGGTSSAFITVVVDPDAPLARPIASDTVLTVSDVLDRTTIDVDVLANVFFADGASSDLGIGVLSGYGAAPEVQSDKRIRVTVENESQIIPFYVSHPDDDRVRAYAFIWVPGYDDALPQVDPNAGKLRVTSEEELRIDLNDYVVALGNAQVRLTDEGSVRATHADGGDLVVDEDTLRFRSADEYFGPASITFEVTDGITADDPEGRAAVLSLAIEVEPRENQPPVFIGGAVDFEPGETRELDLLRLTNYPHPDDLDELEYEVLAPAPEGFTYTLNGRRLVLTAGAETPKGTTTTIGLGVRDAVSEGQAGRVSLSVVPSTRPLAAPAPDEAIAERGSTTVIDVLANDGATNPFPGEPLEVVAVRGIDGDSLPRGVRVTPSADRSRLTVTVSDSADPADTNLQYQVADGTRDRDRYVWGSVRISVQDRPDPVTGVRVTEFGDRSLSLTWAPGAANNSPITGYTVTMTGAETGNVISTSTCSGPASCTVTTPGNGPGNSVRLAVSAVNEIGASDPVLNTRAIWSDVIPPPPTGLASAPLDQGLRVTWRKPVEANSASPISYYVVTVGGVSQNVSVDPGDPAGTTYSRNVSAPSIVNGSATAYSVSARNSAPNTLAIWNEASGAGRPAGAPILTGTPTAGGELEDGSSVRIGWAGSFDSNGRSITQYFAAAYTDDAPSCTVSGVERGDPVLNAPEPGERVKWLEPGTGSVTFTGLTANQQYNFIVWAYNGQGCTAAGPVQATPREAPGTVTAIETDLVGPSAADQYDFVLRGYETTGADGDGETFVYQLTGDGVDGTVSAVRRVGQRLLADGTQYGRSVSVRVKACADYPEGLLCSADWSEAFPLGTPVDADPFVNLTARVTQEAELLQPELGVWTWDAADLGPGYERVVFSCDRERTEVELTEGPGTCAAEATRGGAFPDLRVTVTANGGQTYTNTYDWVDHD